MTALVHTVPLLLARDDSGTNVFGQVRFRAETLTPGRVEASAAFPRPAAYGTTLSSFSKSSALALMTSARSFFSSLSRGPRISVPTRFNSIRPELSPATEVLRRPDVVRELGAFLRGQPQLRNASRT